jgi:hypothetical protein
MKRSGVADLPLHGGRVPQWLAERMTQLGTAITEAVVQDYGASAFLSRLSDPFWFQAFGAVMGMDWHSAGITTSVMGALKRGLTPRANELGIYICGGRGRFSRNTPQELRSIAEDRGFDGEALVRNSRLTARIDNNAIADGFQIYLHSFIVTSDGEWAVVQQGLNDRSGMARRYHWHSAAVRDFVAEPHNAIVGENQGTIMNLVDAQAKPAQTALLDIARENPDTTLGRRAPAPAGHHEVRAENIDLKRLGRARRRVRKGSAPVRRTSALGEARSTHSSVARLNCRSCPRRTEPFHRSRAVFIRARRQGPSSISSPVEDL